MVPKRIIGTFWGHMNDESHPFPDYYNSTKKNLYLLAVIASLPVSLLLDQLRFTFQKSYYYIYFNENNRCNKRIIGRMKRVIGKTFKNKRIE